MIAEREPYTRMEWTASEIERARELAFDVGLGCGAIAKLLAYEYGTALRNPASVRYVLRAYFDWKGRN